MSGTEALVITVSSLIAGLVRGFAGFGGPLLLIPILNIIFAPATTVTAVLLADTIASLQLVPDAWRQATLRVVSFLLLGTMIAIPAGAALLAWAEPVLMKRVISGVILSLALIALGGWRYRAQLKNSGYMGVGALAGLVMGATGIAAVLPLFLNASQETSARNRAHFILWVLVASVWTCLMLALAASPTSQTLTLMLLLLPSYGIGVFIGNRLVRRLSDATLRRVVLLLVVVVATAGLVT
jgi:uncharacterized membrane protein YfcA